jgi:hypothetical protein
MPFVIQVVAQLVVSRAGIGVSWCLFGACA